MELAFIFLVKKKKLQKLAEVRLGSWWVIRSLEKESVCLVALVIAENPIWANVCKWRVAISKSAN